MLKVNVDDVAAAKDAMGLMQEELHKATEKRFSLSNENINAGAAVDAELNASRQLFDRASELSDGVEKYVKNLGEAHDKLAGDISGKKASLAKSLGGTVSNTSDITYDDAATVDKSADEALRVLDAFSRSITCAWESAAFLDDGGGEASKIKSFLNDLSKASKPAFPSVEEAKRAWDCYASAAQAFDDEYSELFSRPMVGDIQNWTQGFLGKVGEKGLDFLSAFIKYDQDPNRPKGIRDPKKLFELIRDQIKKELKDGFKEKLKKSIKNELKEEFKDFLPYDTYFRERKGQHAKNKGRKISNDFKEIIDDWKNGRENEKIRHAKSDGDHSALGKPKGLFETKGEISAVGKSAKMLSKGLGVVGKAIDVYTVGSKGVAAFNGTKGSLGDKLGAGLKASGKEGVKVGASTAVTAVVTGALTVIVPGGPFIAAGVCLVGGLAGGYVGDKVGDNLSRKIFGGGK